MAKKLKVESIEKSDLVEFLNDVSDFSFETKVLKALIGMGFGCEHSGSYADPITNEVREFDIRATKIFRDRFFLRLAVECKNLRPNFPILISCLPRRQEESFHETSLSVNPDKCPIEKPSPYSVRAMISTSKNVRLTGEYSLYKPGDPVGKSCDQVGRLLSGEFTSGDSGIYNKWAQALSSAHDLTYLSCTDGEDRTGDFAVSLVIPTLVVPNRQLWVAQYDSDGNRTADPELVDRCSYFIDQSYFHKGLSHHALTISHLEFLTVDGLRAFIDGLCGDDEKIDASFPATHILQSIVSSERA
ncbi:MAG: hypothetical protein OJF50_006684 [Nitrospira sp.]|jgi:hypothetical protein|nr:hypothetical protein [Nitrospira sp.]